MYSPEDFEIIDMHVHPFEDPVHSISPYGSLKSMDEFDAEMRRAGVDMYAGSVIGRSDPDDFNWIRHLNRCALRLRDRFPHYIPGIHVHGKFVEESCRELEAMKAEGVKLVGELVPYYLGTGDFNTSGMLTLFNEMHKLGMIANLHHVTVEEAEFLAENVRELPLIIAHPGEPFGEWNAKKRFQFVAEHDNMYMDISGTGLFRWDMLRYAVETCGAEKILFGSDMPTCSVGMNLYGALFSRLSKDDMALVMGGNFKRLMGM